MSFFRMKSENQKEIPKHVHHPYYDMGINGSLDGDKANEIIEEIVQILRSKNITVYIAKRLLNDTISSIDKEAILDKML